MVTMVRNASKVSRKPFASLDPKLYTPNNELETLAPLKETRTTYTSTPSPAPHKEPIVSLMHPSNLACWVEFGGPIADLGDSDHHPGPCAWGRLGFGPPVAAKHARKLGPNVLNHSIYLAVPCPSQPPPPSHNILLANPGKRSPKPHNESRFKPVEGNDCLLPGSASNGAKFCEGSSDFTLKILQ